MAMQHHAKKHCNLHQITSQFASFRCVFCLKLLSDLPQITAYYEWNCMQKK